jgi:hypothetical protein
MTKSTTRETADVAGIVGRKNLIINGSMKVNQRGFDGNWAGASIYDYGYDRWFKNGSQLDQVVEAINYTPSTTYTLSGTNVTTQQLTSPASGDWHVYAPFDATNVQLELGSVATDFEHRSYGEELALCQRYYQRISGRSDDQVNVCSGFVNSASLAFAGYSFPTTMRAIPSGTGTGLEVSYGGGTQAVTGDPITDLSIYSAVFAIVTSGLTRGEALRLRLSTGLGSYVDFDAEL